MHHQFTITGQNDYKVDGIFGVNDYVLPISVTSTHFEEVLKLTDPNKECEKVSLDYIRDKF
jgi:hypothetical protein